MGGSVQGEALPPTQAMADVTSLQQGRVAWRIVFPEGTDTALYSPILLGLALPYAWIAAFRSNAASFSPAESTFTAITTLLFPSGLRLRVSVKSEEFDSTIRVSGSYDQGFGYASYSNLFLTMQQVSNIVIGSQTLRGNVRLSLIIINTGIRLPSSPISLRVRFSGLTGASKRQAGGTDVLMLATQSLFVESRERTRSREDSEDSSHTKSSKKSHKRSKKHSRSKGSRRRG